MKPQISFGLAILVISAMAMACSGRPKVVNSELERNKLLWQESKIINYNFEIMKDFGNWIPFLIEVRNGRVVSKQPVGEKGVMDTIENYDDFETMEQAFGSIQGFYDKGYRVEVTYNAVFGYPETILFDHRQSTDSVFIIRISKFEITKTN